MSRPRIRDLADTAGVSVATVNRVLSGSTTVKPATMQRIKETAEAIGFYGLGAIESRVAATHTRYKFGFVLHQPSRTFYRNLAQALRNAAEERNDAVIEVHIEFVEDLAPQNIASRMLMLAEHCDAIGVVAAVHPIVTRAIDELQARGTPVFALISELATTGRVHYIGVDNWKVGRTAAWVCQNMCRSPGKLGILMGNPRYRCQEANESGFRSYFREHATNFRVLEPLLTFESSAIAQEMTEKLMGEHPDLTALYVAGGGITGAIAGLRATGAAGKVVLVGYELMDITREALLDGTMTFVIAHPLPRFADEALSGMIAATNGGDNGNYTRVLPFELYTKENI